MKTEDLMKNTKNEFYRDTIRAHDRSLMKPSERALKTRINIRAGENGKLILGDLHNMTVLGGRTLIQEQAFGLVPNSAQHILLNNLLNIPHSVNVFTSTPNLAIQRKVGWFMIGTGGENLAVPYSTYEPFDYETNLYNPVPFRCVPIASDLSAAEQAAYRLKKIITINGNQYYAYYAKAFSLTSVTMQYENVDYIPSPGDTKQYQPNDPTNPLGAAPVLVYTDFNLMVSDVEYKEYYQANNNGSLTGARLSELGLVFGYDAPNALNGGNNELAGAELFAKLTHTPVFLDTTGSSRNVEYQIFT